MTAAAVAETVEAAGGRTLAIERPGPVTLRAAVFGTGGSRGRCLMLQGYTEFIEKNLETIGELTARGFEVATLDWRGQGLSTRLLPDRHKGHIDSMATHLADLEAVLDVLDGFREGPLTVVAHSMGAHVALRYAIVRPERVRRAVLVAPMLGIGRRMPDRLARLLVEGFCMAGLTDRYIFGGAGYGPRRQHFEGNLLTSDPGRFERLHRLLARNPDLALGDPTFSWVRAAFRSIATMMAPGVLEALPTPLLIAMAGCDSVVSNRSIEAAAARLTAARLARFDAARHEILNEVEPVRAAFWQAVDRFLAETESPAGTGA